MGWLRSLTRFWAIASKEIKQLARDRLTLAMIIGVPLLEITLFGYAINTDVRQLEAAVADQANTTASRELVRSAEATQVIRVIETVAGPVELKRQLDAGRIDVGIFIPPDFERRLQDLERPAAQLLINGSDPIIANIARQLVRLPAPFTAADRSPAVLEARNYYNPEERTEVQIVPGLIGVILNLTMVLFTAIAIVRERERGNLELLIATPVQRGELILGKIFPYIIIGMIQMNIILFVGTWLFDVPLRGSIWDLYVAAAFFVIATLALGITISTMAKTQFQAMQLTVFTFLPSILLSGFMFPFEGMPEPAQYIGEVLPLTHFVRLTRGIVLRGSELNQLLPELFALTAFSVVMVTIAILRFRKRLD
ncbi:ABC transporter [Pseudidiomarina salinarum]|uniref:Transport permease protein n=1 Tax=Pseudidiomarina salinarum TaxID=435908 RepID=A0A094IXJ4_9GAMM|nr:ABC transporter permease [Pseudidiomarina salinarum]KFZ31832.1 ABC transporter [Pseudidiomarina salinarum]RUO70396.1 ABC transporter permease [Pseudidiomarina salinarum]